uniref:Uncharacterized protein n=1 Tax=Anguilla anguilla TaxID=7936 RepID=A0A0E9WFJ6_ANGAN
MNQIATNLQQVSLLPGIMCYKLVRMFMYVYYKDYIIIVLLY